MSQLSIGQHVSDLDGVHDGTLVDIDRSTGYVLQKNGVEIEFPLDRLRPYQPPKPAEQRTLSGPLRDTTLTPAQKALLASVPPDIMAAIARSYAGDPEAAKDRTPFAALPPSKQLEIVRIHLPTLPTRLVAAHTKLVLAMRNLAKPAR